MKVKELIEIIKEYPDAEVEIFDEAPDEIDSIQMIITKRDEWNGLVSKIRLCTS